MSPLMLRAAAVLLVCAAASAQDAGNSARSPRKSKRTPSQRTEAAGTETAPVDQAQSVEAGSRTVGGKRKLYHVPAANSDIAAPAADFSDEIMDHVHRHARNIAETAPADADDAVKEQLLSASLARAGLDAEGKLVHGIPRTLLARGTRMLPNLARNTSCTTPCPGGSCIYVDCPEPVECRGGLCFFYRCDNPRCGGGACKFMECVYPTCGGGACDYIDNATPLEDPSEYCSGGGCTFEGALHTGLPAGDAVY